MQWVEIISSNLQSYLIWQVLILKTRNHWKLFMTQPSEQIINIKNLSTAGKEKVPCGSKDLIERARAQNKSEIIEVLGH